MQKIVNEIKTYIDGNADNTSIVFVHGFLSIILCGMNRLKNSVKDIVASDTT